MSDADPNGLFQFTISYQDPVGNSGDNITSTSDGSLVTIDTINPQLDNITIASSNSVPTLANQNDSINLTFDTTENIETPVVKILGYHADSVTQGMNENQWVATLRVNDGDDRNFLNQGLLAFYPFDGNANDEIGNKDGVVNGASLVVDRHENNDSSFSFSGSNWIDLSGANGGRNSSANLNLPNQDITVSVWVKNNSISDWDAMLGFVQDNGADENGFALGTYKNGYYFAVAGNKASNPNGD